MLRFKHVLSREYVTSPLNTTHELKVNCLLRETSISSSIRKPFSFGIALKQRAQDPAPFVPAVELLSVL